MSNYLTFSSPSTFTIGVVDNTKHWDGTLEYSTNATSWSVWGGTNAISSSADGKLYMRGTGNTYITGAGIMTGEMPMWKLTGSDISCTGNIENLLDYQTVANGEHPTMGVFCYGAMFASFDAPSPLVTAPELPATTLTGGCYGMMFLSCTALTTAPALPATTLTGACYAYMFKDCTSLTTPPALPATTLVEQCYSNMFDHCENLTAVPELPATTLANRCYDYMFSGCTRLKFSRTQSEDYPTPYRIPTEGTATGFSVGEYDGMFDSKSIEGDSVVHGADYINVTLYTPNKVIPATEPEPDKALIIKQSTLESIGDAIRDRKGTSDLIPVPNLASEILSIVKPTGKLTITDTAVKDVTAYAQAQVVDGNLVAGNIRKDVSILGVTGTLQEGITPSGTRNITSNGTYDVTNYANVNVQVEDIPAVVGEKTVTEPGVYDAVEDDLEGYSVVDVAIPTYMGELTNALYISSTGTVGGTFPVGTVERTYTIIDDDVGFNTHEDYKGDDVFLAYGYEANNEGSIVPVLYKTHIYDHPDEVDYQDKFFYVGTETIDGVVYDKWRKLDDAEGYDWDADHKRWYLTNRVVDRVVPYPATPAPKPTPQ